MPGFELFGDAERKEVNEVLESGILARYGFDKARNGVWKAKDLEQKLAEKLNAEYVHAVSSGTAALTTALMALGIGAGHEVILPTFCHVGCYEAIVTTGATPVFADVDETLTLNPEAVKAAITSKTRAVLVVHTCGGMAQMDELIQVCKQYDVLLIEDASQAIGGKYKGKYLGTLGLVGVLSFDFLNTITCGEGGAIVTNDPLIYKRCDEYSDHGHDHLGEHRNEDDHRYFGTNHRISELHAAVGLAQLGRLDQILAIQRRNYNVMRSGLQSVPGIKMRTLPDEDGHSCTHLSFFLPSEIVTREVVQQMNELSLPVHYWYESNWHYIRRWGHFKNGSWMNRLYNDQKKEIMHYSNQVFPISDSIMSRCLSVGINLTMSEEEARNRGVEMAQVINNVIISNKEAV